MISTPDRCISVTLIEEAQDFVQWYNQQHRQSAIHFVTPAERHRGENQANLARLKDLYDAAKERNPQRWRPAVRLENTPVE